MNETNQARVLRIGLIQTRVTSSREENVATALRMVADAADEGVQLAMLPENFNYLGTTAELRANAEPFNGPTLTALREAAAAKGIYVLAGAIKLRYPGGKGLLNTSCLIDPDGEVIASYHKIHLFDARIDGITYDASAVEEPGLEAVVAAVAGVPIGLTICYDLRFPELFRILMLQGAKLICVPSSFTVPTGKDHWEVLLRARAIENSVYIAAPAVWGKRPPYDHPAFGRSMVIDPWGVVVAQASDRTTTLVVDLDLSLLEEIREAVPAHRQRQPAAYLWPEEERRQRAASQGELQPMDT